MNKTIQLMFFCLLVALLLLQGGYNLAVSYIASVVLLSILPFIHTGRRALELQRTGCIAAVAFLGLLSSLDCGFGSYSLAHLAPYWMLLSSSIVFTSLHDSDFDRLIAGLRYLSYISSAVAIFLYFVLPSCFGNVSAARLQAYFQYANTAAVWFATSFLLLIDSPLFTKFDCIVPFIALVLTRSVAVTALCAICLLIYLILEKRSIAIFFVLAFGLIIVFGIFNLLSARIAESLQTFIERIIQIYDGLGLAVTNPILGIGPGVWRQSYRFIQSAQYTANVVHCGYLQILLDCGIFALIAFVWLCVTRLISIFKQRSGIHHSSFLISSVILILLHIAIDIDIQFAFIDLLLALFLSRGNLSLPDVEKHLQESNLFNKIGLFLLFSAIISLAVMTGVRDCLIEKGDKGSLIFQNDPEVAENYLLRLCDEGEYAKAVDTVDSIRLRSIPSELQLLEIGSLYCMDMRDDAEEKLLDLVDSQQRNVSLYKTATSYFDYYGISDEGYARLGRIENQANKMTMRPPASYLKNQTLYHWTKKN